MENKDWIMLGLAFVPLMLVYLYSYNYEVFYFLYNISGIRAIVEKIHPPIEGVKDGYRKPSTFMLWVISIYIALFSIASARYDRAVNSYEQQIAAFQTQMTTDCRAEACQNLISLQYTQTPHAPNIFNIYSTIASLYKNEQYKKGKEIIKNTIMAYKRKLTNAQLGCAMLDNIFIEDANLQDSNLRHAHLRQSFLQSVNFSGADLRETLFFNSTITFANLRNTNLDKSDLTKADLSCSNISRSLATKANFEGANLCHTKLIGTDLSFSNLANTNLSYARLINTNFFHTNLRGAILINATIENPEELSIDQLKLTKTLYKATLPPEFKSKLKQTHPHLFTKPDYNWYDWH